MTHFFVITKFWKDQSLFLKKERIRSSEFKTWSTLFRSAERFLNKKEAMKVLEEEKFPYPVTIQEFFIPKN